MPSWEVDVALRDGGTAHLRPIRPDDVPEVERFHAAQSAESIYLRFFAPLVRLSASDLRRFTHVDQHDRVAFVITLGERIIGIGRYERLADDVAEVAFNISDAHQGRGLGTVLLEHLAAAARRNGIRRFVADVLPQNQRMMQVFRDAGYLVHAELDDGLISVEFQLDPTDRTAAVMQAREHRSEARSMQALLNPRSVVLFGASRRPGTIGHRLLRHLIDADFTGDLFLVHPHAESILGVSAVPRLAELSRATDLSKAPGQPDGIEPAGLAAAGPELAVIAVPADAVLDVVADCAAAGVRALVVLSRGFAETDRAGLDRQRDLVRMARANGMRVVGPNSWGVLNTYPTVRLNASLATHLPPPGRLGLFCQSGALSHVVLAEAARRGVGISTFLSAGNRADVSGNDCMQYWQEDPATDAVGLYLESIGNPRKFSRIARRLARRKPVIVLKSGMSGFGVPPGHAVRPTRAPRGALDAMLRQSGCIRVESVQQLFDVARLVLDQPLPAGPGVGIVSNSDALAVLLADVCSSWDLHLAGRPVILPPDAGAAAVTDAVRQVAATDGVQSVAVAYLPLSDRQPVEDGEPPAPSDDVLRLLPLPVPVAVCGPDLSGLTVPTPYATPEEAVRALAASVRYGGWRRRDPGPRVDPKPRDTGRAQALVAEVLARSPAGEDLDQEQVSRLLACYGIDHPAAVLSDASTAPGVHCLIRTIEDPLFGPVVTFAVGPDADLLDDLGHRIPPLTQADVSDLIGSVRATPKLFGYGGAEPVDLAALHDLVSRVSCLADDLPEVAELTLDPVVATAQGVRVGAAAARVGLAAARTDPDRRELPATT